MDLQKLLRPRSMAILGASEKYGLGSDTCRNAQDFCRDLSRVYYIHPKYDTVFGRKCYPDIASVPDSIDLLVICTNQRTVIPALEQAAAKGCGAAVVYASGYSEMRTPESLRLEDELAQAARRLDMAVMGPNCGGFVNLTDGICCFAFAAEMGGKAGGIGFFSQSGQLCINMLNCPELRFSLAVSGGNCRIVRPEDYLEYMVEDENTRVIAMYLEGVKDPARFTGCLRRAAEKRKPVVVLKMGRSPKGRATAASHTGSLAGSDGVFDALCRKYGVIRVEDMQDLRSTAGLLATLRRLPAGTGFASVSLSGGETGICADSGYLAGLEYPDFSPRTVAALREILPPYAGFANPLDMTSMPSYDRDLLARALATVMEDENVDMGFIGWTIREDSGGDFARNMMLGIRQAYERVPSKPLAVMSFMEFTRNRELLEGFLDAGIPVLPSTRYAMAALKHLADFVAYRPEEHSLEAAIPSPPAPGRRRRTLSEYQSRRLLRDFGVELDTGVVASTRREAEEYAAGMAGPLAMKIVSEDVPHKTDAGGVRLNVAGPEQAGEAFDQILDTVRSRCPQARLEGVLLERMLPAGTEFILGVQNDPQFGPMVLAGLGGVLVEVFRDAALYPAPLGLEEARAMLESLRSAALFRGVRGGEPLDMDAFCRLIVQVGQFAVAHKDTLRELDLNPVFVYEKGRGVAAADALAVLEEPAPPEYSQEVTA